MPRPKNKEEYRAELANIFINALEEKGLEWRKEWAGIGGGPHNGVTKASYRGCNAFYLSLVSMAKGYTDPRWVTMTQIMDKEKRYHPNEQWHLKKGSKASYVEYWYPYDVKNKKALTWEQYREDIKNGRNEKEFSLSTRYTAVFNAAEVEGMPEYQMTENPGITQDELIGRLSTGTGVLVFTDGGDSAYYTPTRDEIHIPTPESFFSEYALNATLLHELSHATGHPSRLNRPQGAFFGTDQYAYEELVAEISSCFMGAELQVEPTAQHIENHKAYVQGWIEGIKQKPETLVRAIKDAQAAANYMDYTAGLINEAEYNKSCGQFMTVMNRTDREIGR